MTGWVFIIVLTICLFAWGCREIRECGILHENAEHNETDAKNTFSSPTFGQTSNRENGFCAYFEKPENVIALLTLMAVGYYTWLTKNEVAAALDANKISQSALTDENRPWIKVTIVPGDIIWAKYGWPLSEMEASVYFQNVGHSPAIRVQMMLDTYLNGTRETREHKQTVGCRNLTNDPVTDGRVIFPGDQSEMTEISAGVRHLIGVQKSAIDAAPPKMTQNGTAYSFTIYGCADYVFGSQGQHYQTFFSYDVYWGTHEKVIFGADVINPLFNVGQNYPAKDIILSPSYDGNDAN